MPDAHDDCIRIEPLPHFLAEQSDPDNARFLFSYTISITNTGEEAVQLLSRHWIITDGNNAVQEVQGMGVVGQQPRLAPGETFQYTSGCALSTPIGTMKGTYQMLADSGRRFDADIPEFVLASPRALH